MTSHGGGGYQPNYGAGYDGSSRQEMLPFFLPGEGIKRQVIQTDLPRYLGNNALSRPGWDKGVPGYWYTGYRPLTDAQVQSLKQDSQKWSSERELMSHRYPGHELPGYERSATFRDSLQTNSDGNNPNHPYPSFPPIPGPPAGSFQQYGSGQASYHHPTPYSAQPAPSGPGIPPAPNNDRSRFEYVPSAEGGKWWDRSSGQYVQSYPPPENSSTTGTRPTQNEPPTGAPDETDLPYRRPTEPNPGTEPTGYYGPTHYYPRN
ncbi:unnamed protein product [Tuber melanosporum]|uniref:(Perigord truffle) hypothetical protein n=1 Tax=Tuber melanosporum (strain Mel28) TaxID=656061 RepID=D5G4D3_TUBMM|nr:uncharacterized protein GSTUM_00004058001 [Tuber melanosporum]CAZ79376.1 unnamed protein product [Tuber melanosporum]